MIYKDSSKDIVYDIIKDTSEVLSIMKSQSRDYRFDNLKGILIFLVILEHALTRLQSDSMMVSSCINSVILSFHMPAFVFISGFFSKNVHLADNSSTKIVKSLLIPFVIAHALMWLLTSRSISSLFNPGWTLWYLLSLFFWKIMITPISKLRFAIIFSLAISICVGFSPADRFFSLSRTVAFLPFFLLGYKTTPATIDRIRKTNKSSPIMILLVLFSLVILMKVHNLPVLDIFQMADPYSSLEGVSKLQGMLLRIAGLLIGFISTACLLILVPQKRSIISDLGKNTMTVYMGHSFFLIVFRKLLSMTLPALMTNELFVIILSFALSVIICYFFGNQWIVTLYNKALDWISTIVLVKPKQKPDLSE